MAEESKQKQIEEIEEKISEELRDVERLEKKERELIKEEHDHKLLVHVKVDNEFHEVRPGDYRVSEFKEVVGVPAAKELEQIIDGVMTPLSDDAIICIKGGEVFVSHVRRGGSSHD